MNKITGKDLFNFSITIGIKSILLRKKITKEAIKRILCPLDPPRYYELPQIANSLLLKRGSKILDISSPKLLVFYLAEKYPYINFFAIDKFEKELDNWIEITEKPSNLVLLSGDATQLNFPNNYFDEIFSVSVIEHIGNSIDHGDSDMVKEIYRVLKKKGRFLLTTVISTHFNKIYKNRQIYSNNKSRKKTFFSRIYDYQALTKRILKVKPFTIFDEEICNYRFSLLENIFLNTSPFTVPFGFVFLFLYKFMIRTTRSHAIIKKRAEYFGVLVK